MFAELFVRGRLFVHGDAAATGHNILTHELLFRSGFAVEVFYCACNLPLILIFYDLFRVVNRRASVLLVYFSLLGTGIESVSLLGHFAPLVLLGKGHTLNAFTTEQLQALAYVSLRMFEHGFALALVFFGIYCLLIGYLILRSTFFPRLIGAMLAIEGVCYLMNSFANFLAPEFGARFFPFLMVSGLAEVSFCVCLILMGVNAERWYEQARSAGMANR